MHKYAKQNLEEMHKYAKQNLEEIRLSCHYINGW